MLWIYYSNIPWDLDLDFTVNSWACEIDYLIVGMYVYNSMYYMSFFSNFIRVFVFQLGRLSATDRSKEEKYRKYLLIFSIYLAVTTAKHK